MQTSLFLAQMLGPILAVIGAGMLVNRRDYRAMAAEFLESRPLIYLAGLAALVPGLAIVIVHNLWTADWRLLITLFGWLALVGGVVRLVLPRQVARLGSAVLERQGWVAGAGIVLIVLGALLSYVGYLQ